jgi:hypothetical protein
MREKLSPFLTLAFIAAITLVKASCASAEPPAVINASGQKLECIFQGIKPDPAFLRAKNAPLQRLRKSWNGIG